MVMGESATPVDFLVIGGGPGGYTAALRAAQLGRKVTLVEDTAIGGTCLNVGCIPSKMLIEAADRYAGARRYVADAALPRPDLGAWQEDRSGVVASLNAGVCGELKSGEVELITGQARFTSRGRVAVSSDDDATRFLEFRHAVIATGSRPRQLAEFPVDGRRIVDSTGALALRELPDSVAVIGAGYIGIELATAFAKLGSQVTLLEVQSRILPEMPAMFARPVDRRLGELGITRHLGCTGLAPTSDGVRFTTSDVEQTVAAEAILVAAGRVPNTDQIGLHTARVDVDETGRIPVQADRTIRGTQLAAIGDVVAGPMLAHKASAEAVVAAEALCGHRVAFDPAAIPLVVFSDPEIASAGMDAEAAKAAGISAHAVTVPLRANARAATVAASIGFAQLVVDTDLDAVIGVHLVGPHASELIAEGVLAIEMGAAPGDLAATIHPHPTLSESLHEAARRCLIERPAAYLTERPAADSTERS
jgi:dihydrolipoamide dehydrogenase